MSATAYERIQSHPKFQQLVAQRGRLATMLSLAMLVIYFGFILLVAYAPGFLGTPLVCDALADTGHAATAWRLLLQRQCPSWLYPVTLGATTIWERWNSMLPDGSINPGEMTSFNHYAFGAVADFLDFSRLYFPWIFNVADAAITIGIIILLVDMLLQEKEAAPKGADAGRKPQRDAV